MATVKVNIKDWPKYLAAMGEKAHTAMRSGIISGVHRCIPLMQRRTEQAPPASDHGAIGAFNTGNYRRRWRVSMLEHGASIGNDSPYASIIDGGRRPGGGVRIDAIEQWARRRLGLSAKEAKKAAFPIARAIKRRGLKPRRVMSGGIDEMTDVVVLEANRALAMALGE